MNSFFSKDSFLPSGLKRHARARPRKAPPSAKTSQQHGPLQIIQEVSEEEETRFSFMASEPSTSSSCSSPHDSDRSAGRSRALRAKHRHVEVHTSDIWVTKETERLPRLPLSGDDVFFVSGPPRSASLPPSASTPTSKISSPASFNITFPDGISFDFPRPPQILSPSSPFPNTPRLGSSSPTPSMTSDSSSPDSNSTGLPITPSSSDDEFCPPPRILPRRVSIKPLFIAKSTPKFHRSPARSDVFSETPRCEYDNNTKYVQEQRDEEEDEARDWYSRQFSEILTLCSPLPPTTSSRPESISLPPAQTPPPPVRRRVSKALPDIPAPLLLPSAQLDPAFPRRRRSIPTMPKRAPPPIPAPLPPLPTLRPPPRMSIPADIGLFDVDIEADLDSPTSSFSSPFTSSGSSSSVYSQDTRTPNPDLEFDLDIPFNFDFELPLQLPLSLPTSPIDLELDIAAELARRHVLTPSAPMSPAIPETPTGRMYMPEPELPGSPRLPMGVFMPEEPEQERVLRSRWSSSTLSSMREAEVSGVPGSASSKMLRFYFGSSKKALSRSFASPLSPTTPKGAAAHTHMRGWSAEVEPMSPSPMLRRRGSRSSSSAGSESSGDSSSSGLRRKPIPVEMFIKC